MPALTQVVTARVYDCSSEYPDCVEWTDHTIDVDDAQAARELAGRIAATFQGNEETQDWDILVHIETEDGTVLASARSANDHAEYLQDSMDEVVECVRDYTTECVGVRDGQWYTWSRNGGKRGVHDCMTNRGWRERYEEPKKADLEEAYAALMNAGLEQDEAVTKLAGHARMDERDVREEIGIATEIDEIATVLELHGDKFAGNNVMDEAEDWHDHEFTAAEVDSWCEVGVWDAATARELADAGLTPAQAHDAAESLIEASDDAGDEFTDGDPIYAACNGDLDVARIIEAAE